MEATRLNIALTPTAKNKIRRAAELKSQTVKQFVVSTLVQEAGNILAGHTSTTLSDRDRDLFLKLLDSPPKPNKALRMAAKEYRKQSVTCY